MGSRGMSPLFADLESNRNGFTEFNVAKTEAPSLIALETTGERIPKAADINTPAFTT